MAYSSLVGAQVRRKEDPRLITGNGMYVGDLHLPGMRYVAFVRSPYAHAAINGIDKSAAEAMPGVVAVFTGEDLKSDYKPMPMANSGEGGDVPTDEEETRSEIHYALSLDRVRHVGEAVAVVIAESSGIAEDAVDEVVVDWEELPAVVDMLEAMEEEAPKLFPDGNICHSNEHIEGDVDAAFASADRIIKQRLVNHRVAGVPMEGRAVVATPDYSTGGLTVWTSTQAPHSSRSDIADVLGLAENQVRAIAPEVGGGFGVKIGIYPEDVVLAALARRLNTPVSWVENRSENMIATTQGRAQVADIEVAVQQDGTVTGLKVSILADVGAYPLSPDMSDLTMLMATGVYHIPAASLKTTGIHTNTTPIAAYRGAGRPEAAFYIERAMDLVAAELGIDPAEIRRRNFIQPDQFPYETAAGAKYDSGEYDKALSRALDISDYQKLREEQERRLRNNEDRVLGIGISCYVEVCGFGPYESAIVRVEPTGTVTVFTGISPHGQGQETTFAQIVADRLGVDYHDIIVRHGDTRDTPLGKGTMGSRGLAVGGSAVIQASDKVRNKALEIAAHVLEASAEDVEVSNGRYQVKGVPSKSLTLAEIAKAAYGSDLPEGMDPGLESTDFFKVNGLLYPFGAHVAVVEIERETGFVQLQDYYSVDDCGPRISPQLVEGQVHGGLAQGISQALLEEVSYDEQGQPITGSLMDYVVPKASHFPSFTTDQTVTPTPHNSMGAKGIGEAATIGSTPAVANAVNDALRAFGVQHMDMPFRPEKVWKVLQNGQNS